MITGFFKKLFGLDRPLPDGLYTLPSGWKFEPLPGLTPSDKAFICRALGAHAALVNPYSRAEDETYQQYAASLAKMIVRAAMGGASPAPSGLSPAADRPAHTAPETTSPSSQSN